MDFDDGISLFAVYDGHGGAEVAQYAAKQLPLIVKDELANKESLKDALINAYLKFDDSLVESSVIEELNALRGVVTEDSKDGTYTRQIKFKRNVTYPSRTPIVH